MRLQSGARSTNRKEKATHTNRLTWVFVWLNLDKSGKDEVIFPILKKWHFKGTLIVSVWLSVIPELDDVRTTQGIVKTIRLTHSSLKGLWSYQCIKCEVRQWGRSKRAQNYFRCATYSKYFLSLSVGQLCSQTKTYLVWYIDFNVKILERQGCY